MEAAGVSLLERHLGHARVFLEYGSGGSSVMASQSAVERIYSVDSDRAFLRAVQDKIAETGAPPGKYLPIYVDIGPTGAWGTPTSREFMHLWPDYLKEPWRRLAQDGQTPDLILIDGRFRVASLLISLMHAPAGCVVLFDDYADRPVYHVVERFLKLRRKAGRMAEFVVPEKRPEGLAEALERFCQDPN
ncbi:hypothetical protein [Bordetella hinzii]|uniref:hypothetical protein n=1 Tax=Bordetella hinzii TaxID=103855 RepID=UPI0039FCDB3E